ncbi:MAG: hypothetical protein WBE06_06185 [Phycisphaerae bacterium]
MESLLVVNQVVGPLARELLEDLDVAYDGSTLRCAEVGPASQVAVLAASRDVVGVRRRNRTRRPGC